MKLCAAVARALADRGVDTIFGVMGEGNLLILDHFVHELGHTYVAAATEFGAVTMANGHSQAGGDVSVATVTQGPGLTNTISALRDCVSANAPVVLLAGDTYDAQNKQYVEQADYVAPTGAGFVNVESHHSVLHDVARAIDQARHERRPVVLNVPVELQQAEVAYRSIPAIETGRRAVSDEELEMAVGVLATARRPLILVGDGVARSGAVKDVLALAERLGAPIATTLRGKDLFTAEEGSIGICGSLSSAAGYEVIGKADCVFALGASLSKLTTDRGALFEGKSVIACDIDPARLGANLDVDACIAGDVASVASQVVQYLDLAELDARSFRDEARRIVDAGSVAEYRDMSGEGVVDIRTALTALEAALPTSRNLAVDVGRFMEETVRRVHSAGSGSFIYGASYGALGIGMGAAIGATFAAPDVPTVLVCGDGGFMMTGLTEFNTAVRYNRDLICVVLNDGCYGAEEIQFRELGKNPDLTMFDWPDFAAVAMAMGGNSRTIRSLSDLAQLGNVIAGRPAGPLLIDVKISPNGIR